MKTVKTLLREQAEELRRMMDCGHPVAALNKFESDPSAPPRLTTMYCRSCAIQAGKEEVDRRRRPYFMEKKS